MIFGLKIQPVRDLSQLVQSPTYFWVDQTDKLSFNGQHGLHGLCGQFNTPYCPQSPEE
jgi:hypothetical protein